MSDLTDQAPVGSKAKILLLGDFDPKGQRIIRDPYYVSTRVSLHLFELFVLLIKKKKM